MSCGRKQTLVINQQYYKFNKKINAKQMQRKQIDDEGNLQLLFFQESDYCSVCSDIFFSNYHDQITIRDTNLNEDVGQLFKLIKVSRNYSYTFRMKLSLINCFAAF